MQVNADTFKQMIDRMCQADPAAPGGEERRQSPRVNLTAKVAIISDFASIERPVDVTVRDLSAGGVGFEHDAPLHPGSNFVLLLPAPDCRDAALSILCVVRQFRQIGPNQYAIGAEFRQVLGAPSLKAIEDADTAEAA